MMRALGEEDTIINNIKHDKVNKLQKSLMVVFLVPKDLGCVYSVVRILVFLLA